MRPPARLPTPAALALAAASAAALVAPATRPARAQMVALPVVQAPFSVRPLAVAVDAGSGGDGLGSLGIAVGLRNGGSRLSGTLGVAAVRGFAVTRPTFGVRVAYAQPLGESRSLGVAPFVGLGVMSQGDSAKQAASDNGRPILPASVTVVPVGVGLGYRRVVAGRTVAVHVTPQAQYWRLGARDTLESTGKVYVRAGVGIDVAVTRQIGLAVAYETGAASEVVGSGRAATGLAEGPRPSLLGVALSYAPRRNRR